MATIIPTFKYDDARAAIAFLVDAFGFQVHAAYDNDDQVVAHAELRLDDAFVMVGDTRAGEARFPAGPSTVYVVIDDPDAHCERARAAGAEIVEAPVDRDYGSREYVAQDPAGNLWAFGTYRPG